MSWRDVAKVVLKEAQGGTLMGSLLGLLVLMVAYAWPSVSNQVRIFSCFPRGFPQKISIVLLVAKVT